MSEKRVLTPYGVYYYLRQLDQLKSKLEPATRALLYIQPQDLRELGELVGLKEVERFEDIGTWAEKWTNYIRKSGLNQQDCRKLYEQTIVNFNKFVDLIMTCVLITPRLEVLNINRVREDSKSFFNDETLKWLEELGGLAEFNQACRAILVNLPTAAGFYLLRICERSLRELYKKETGKDVEKRTWGAILDELEKHYKNKDKPPVLHIIEYLKNIRNSIAHPDKYLTQREAENLLTYVVSIIEEIKGYIEGL